MSYRNSLIACLLLAGVVASPANASGFQSAALDQAVVIVTAYRARQALEQGTGFVVKTDRYNGYVLTHAALVERADTITVRLPGTRAELVAQPLAASDAGDSSSDNAPLATLLKVNGLSTPPLTFSDEDFTIGSRVWSVHRHPEQGDFLVSSPGALARVEERDAGGAVLYHSASVQPEMASILVNECGQALGFNLPAAVAIRMSGADTLTRALGVEGIATMLAQHSIQLSYADTGCVSAVAEAREEAARASEQARAAARDAEQARRVAEELERQLQASEQSNEGLIDQARAARERAEAAIEAAEAVRQNAEQTRLDFERQTAAIKAETSALMRYLEQDRRAAEDRYRAALAEQQRATESRERLWLSLALVSLLVAIAVGALMFRRATAVVPAGSKAGSFRKAAVAGDDANDFTDMHAEDLVEYVLDGRDEDGIRYLLRISGDQLKNGEGIIIGRNPQDSPYIINHADVSRRHARMRVMKNRVFIEDLGSTNGTSVNGQAIDDKGPVSVDNGDQIIIGSVVMKLRVLGA